MSTQVTQTESDEVSERVEYEPTDAEIEAARDSEVHTDHVTVEPSLGDAHKTVRERVEKIVWAAHQNGVLQKIDVDTTEYDYSSVQINIRALENWGDKGQHGFDSFHIVLGRRGGISIATRRSLMVGDSDYESFRNLLRAVKRMH